MANTKKTTKTAQKTASVNNKNQKKANKIWIVAAVVLMFLVYFFAAINRVPSNDQAVHSDWMNLLRQYEKRADNINALATRMRGTGLDDLGIVQQVQREQKRAQIVQADEYLIEDEEALALYVHRQELVDTRPLTQTIRATPQLIADPEVLRLVEALEKGNDAIDREKKTYDQAVDQYNKSLTGFPSGFWRTWLYPEMMPRATIQSLLSPSN